MHFTVIQELAGKVPESIWFWNIDTYPAFNLEYSVGKAMIHNIIDHRSNKDVQDIDAVFEIHISCALERTWTDGNGHEIDISRCRIIYGPTARYHTTVRDAALFSESAWPMPVELFLYDAGSKPLGDGGRYHVWPVEDGKTLVACYSTE